ncbi:MAG: class I SAM-dependent methyltransferase [Nevskiales bacterium]
MKDRIWIITLVVALVGLLALLAIKQDQQEMLTVKDIRKQLKPILDGEHRSAEHQARDRYRHPMATLAWFGVEPNMTVVEIWPGAGWYTEILAPYLREQGRLYAAGFEADSEIPFYRINAQKLKEKFAARPDLYDKVIVTEFRPPEKLAIAPANSADRVLTFRNVHNWMKSGHAEQVFEAMYQALKPGGLLGVVEHREDPKREQDPQALSGYVTEAYVKQLAENAGFEFMMSSEVNANPQDTRDHPKGVWTLPPSLRLGDTLRDEYLAIGESDRMTLKFRKPK